jgi:hypothetical protein
MALHERSRDVHSNDAATPNLAADYDIVRFGFDMADSGFERFEFCGNLRFCHTKRSESIRRALFFTFSASVCWLDQSRRKAFDLQNSERLKICKATETFHWRKI